MRTADLDDLDLEKAEGLLRETLVAEMKPEKWRAELGAALLAGDDARIAVLVRHLSGNLAQSVGQLVWESRTPPRCTSSCVHYDYYRQKKYCGAKKRALESGERCIAPDAVDVR